MILKGKFYKANIALILTCAVVATVFSACLRDQGETDPCLGVPPTFNANAFPVITASCAQTGCHVTGATFGDFTTYAGIKLKVDNGSFYNRTIVQKSMPIGAKLSKQDFNTLKCWLKDGAQNN